MENQTLNWRSVLWSGVLIFLIPYVLRQLFDLMYGVYVGFQVRGDPEGIAQGFAVLNASVWYPFLPYVLTAAAALWRGRVLGNMVEALVAAAITAVLWFVVGMAFGNAVSTELTEAGLMLVVALGMCIAGTFLGKTRPVTA